MVVTRVISEKDINPLALSQIKAAPWDDFDAADGTLLSGRVMPSGHTWGLTGAGASTAQINRQGYVNTGVSYAFVSDTQDITEIECVVSWTAVSGQVGTQGTASVIAFTSDAASPVSSSAKLLHFQFHSQGYNLLKSLSGPGSLIAMASAAVELNSVPVVSGSWYGSALKLDGTRYKIRMVVSVANNTLTLYMPDGTVLQYADSDISTIMTGCKTAFWEHGGNGVAGFADMRFHGSAIGPSKAGNIIEASSNKDTAILRGLFAETGFTSGNGGYKPRLASPQAIPLTGTGWYTIATESDDTDNKKMGGVVTIWGKDTSNRKVLYKITVGAEIGIPQPYNIFKVQGFLGNYGGGVIDLFRLSMDDSTHQIHLDIHIDSANANGATLHADYEGYFTPVTTPVSGASALGTRTITYAAAPVYSLIDSGNAGRVADLPAATDVPMGTRGFVNNSNATLAAGLGNTVAGGGANKVPVYSDGTNWIIG